MTGRPAFQSISDGADGASGLEPAAERRFHSTSVLRKSVVLRHYSSLLVRSETAQAIPKRLDGLEIGEASAWRNKALLKSDGTVIVLRRGVPRLPLCREIPVPDMSPMSCGSAIRVSEWHRASQPRHLIGVQLVAASKVAFVDICEQGEFAPLCSFVSHYWGEERMRSLHSLFMNVCVVRSPAVLGLPQSRPCCIAGREIPKKSAARRS